MQEGLANYLKERKVQFKFANLEELCRALLGVMDEDKEGMQVIINAIHEQQIYFACINHRTIEILCEKLSNIYSLRLDAEELIKEATSTIDRDWDNIKKYIKSENDARKLIDGIFNNKTGESNDNIQ